MRTNDIIILIDLDDTLIDLLGSWIYYLNNKYQLNVEFSSIKSWDLSTYFPTLTDDQIYGALEDPVFWDKVKPLPGAVHYVRKLKEAGYRMYICTYSHYKTLAPKLDRVVFKYFKDIFTQRDIIVIGEKNLVKGHILIDDAVHNLVKGTYRKILRTMPHNIDFDAENAGMVRCRSWKDIYYAVLQITKNLMKEN